MWPVGAARAERYGTVYFNTMEAEGCRWISDPLSVVQELLDAGRSAKDYFDAELHSSDGCRLKVPLLNAMAVHSLPHHSLVRYRCMIQDQFDPEFYFKVYHIRSSADASNSSVACSGLYRDITHHPVDCEIDVDHPENVTADRQTLYCVPIPGETPWVKEIYHTESTTAAGVLAPVGHVTVEDRQPKRRLSDCAEMEESSLPKKPREDQLHCDRGAAGQLNCEQDLNLPLPWESGTPCLVKVYEGFEEYKVATSVEVFGVLSTDPSLAQVDQAELDPFGMETASERRAHCPPPSLIPRLHAITVRHLYHTNPLLSWQLKSPLDSTAQLLGEVQATRKLLLALLTDALMGDQLAAEFTLLHLLSYVHGRTELLAIGKFALNISNCSPRVVSNLKQLFQLLLTKSVCLPLSLENMNQWQFTPKKDYTANRLMAGMLQLTNGSHILVDETSLSTGQLNEVGVKNLTTLGNIIQWQKLNYDFHYHTVEFQTDLQVLIASEGKSILQVDCHVPLEPVSSNVVAPSLSSAQLTQVRQYLSLHRLLDYSLTQQVQKGLEEDFVSLRQNDSKMTGAMFQYLLSLSRLLSLSYGCGQLNLELWSQAKHFDQLRRQRLN